MDSNRKSVIWGYRLDGSGTYIWDREQGKFEPTSPSDAPTCSKPQHEQSKQAATLRELEGFWTEEGSVQAYPLDKEA